MSERRIRSDLELSDPFPNGMEAFDPGDVYMQNSGPGVPPGGDGFKDDKTIFQRDPVPGPDEGTSIPLAEGSTEQYGEYFDMDGHDQVNVSMREIIPSQPFEQPIEWRYSSECVGNAKFLAVSFDDDQADGWPAVNVPVTKPSPTNRVYGSTQGRDEIVGVTITPNGPFYRVVNTYPIADEVSVHQSLTPNPTSKDNVYDDDVDSLDVVSDQGACPIWLFSADHEASFGLDPGGIYEVTANGPVLVVHPQFHLGLWDDPETQLIEDADLDAFEMVLLPGPQMELPVLAVLFSVDEDDPLTPTVDESGGLEPRMIYQSYLTGRSTRLLEQPLADDIDALTNWHEEMQAGPPQLTIGDVSLAEGNSGTTTFNFALTLDNPSSSPVTVQFATQNGTAIAGSDYVAAAGSVTISAGSNGTTIPVQVIGDTTFEPNDRFFVNLTGVVGATIADGQGIGTIINDDQALDFGDAPDGFDAPGYPTYLDHNGARHVIAGPYFGNANDDRDAEQDGQPNATATGDDIAGQDDEDGVTIPVLAQAGRATITVEVGGDGGAVAGWIDFDGSGSWEDRSRSGSTIRRGPWTSSPSWPPLRPTRWPTASSTSISDSRSRVWCWSTTSRCGSRL